MNFRSPSRDHRYVEGNRVVIEMYDIPIGSNYRENFLKSLGP